MTADNNAPQESPDVEMGEQRESNAAAVDICMTLAPASMQIQSMPVVQLPKDEAMMDAEVPCSVQNRHLNTSEAQIAVSNTPETQPIEEVAMAEVGAPVAASSNQEAQPAAFVQSPSTEEPMGGGPKKGYSSTSRRNKRLCYPHSPGHPGTSRERTLGA